LKDLRKSFKFFDFDSVDLEKMSSIDAVREEKMVNFATQYAQSNSCIV